MKKMLFITLALLNFACSHANRKIASESTPFKEMKFRYAPDGGELSYSFKYVTELMTDAGPITKECQTNNGGARRDIAIKYTNQNSQNYVYKTLDALFRTPSMDEFKEIPSVKVDGGYVWREIDLSKDLDMSAAQTKMGQQYQNLKKLIYAICE